MIETGLTISAFEKSLTIIFLSISLSLFPCCSFYVPNRDFWQQDVILHDIFDRFEGNGTAGWSNGPEKGAKGHFAETK